MFRPMIVRFGLARSTLLLSVLAIAFSLFVYLAIALSTGTYRPVGLLISLIAPALAAPPLCLILLRISLSFFRAQEALLKVQGELERMVMERTQELGTANDQLRGEIQERKQIEYELRQSEARYRLLAENMEDVIWTLDVESTRLTYVSPSVRKLTGFTPEQVMGHPLEEFLTPDAYRAASEQLALRLREFASEDKPQNRRPYQLELLCSDASTVPVEIVTTLLADERGRAFLMGVSRDITERHAAEQELIRSREDYRSIFERTMVGIFRSTPEGRYLDVNPAMARIYGYETPEEMTEMVTSIGNQIYIDPEERLRVLRKVEKHGLIENHETQHRRKDGTIIWASATLHAVMDESGRVTHYYGTVADITRRKKAEAELDRYREKLEELVRERTTELEEKNTQLELEIRERARGEAELRKLSRAIEASRATVVITDREGTIEYANPAFSLITGYTTGEAIGQNPRILKSGSQSKEFYEDLWKAILAGEVWEGQLCNRKKDGELYWESASISPVRNAAGEIAHFVAVKEDITEKKRLDEALKHQYVFLQTVIDAIPSPIFFKDNDGRYLGCNTSFERYLKRSRDEIIGGTVYDLSPRELADTYDVMDRDLLARGGVQVYEAKGADTESGAVRDVIFNKATFENIDGSVGGIVGVILDITERKKMEEAIRDSEIKSRTILEAVFTGIMVIDPETHVVVDVNTCAQKMIGRPRDEIVGHLCHTNVCPAEPGKCPITDLGQAIDSSERKLVRSDGTEIPIIKTVVSITLEGHTRLLESFVDITELKQMEQQLKEAKQAADAANRAKSAFLASMSHEIRTPMNVILGFSQLMQRGPALNSQQEQYLDTINRSGEHLLTLINDILEMSKIEAGRTTLNPTAFDLHALLDEVEQMFRLRASNKNLQFSIARADDLPRFVVTDEGKLRQVLINLLGNAVKFTDQGGVVVRIGVKGEDPAHLSLLVAVEDTGHGISEEEMGALFQPFHQTAAGTRVSGGTGLGLAISHEFVRLLGGEIKVESRLGSGSTFMFHIQMSLGKADAVAKKEEGRRVRYLDPGQVPPRVLIVDDNDDNRAIVGNLLGHVGFEVQKAKNGHDAIEIFDKWQPALILMDVRMPVMDGYEATRRIRKGTGGRDVKIIIMTAGAFTPSREEALIAGADDFMVKPFRETELLEKIAALLGVRCMYEDDLSGPAETPAEEPAALEAGSPGAVPDRLTNLVREAAIDGDFDRVIELAAEIAAFDTRLAFGFRQLAERFDSRRLLEIMDSMDVKGKAADHKETDGA